jgi:hypothetical protein
MDDLLFCNTSNYNVNKFFSDMREEIDLINMITLAVQEYFILGEKFTYAELDKSKGTWNRLMILNPDYVNVKRTLTEPIPTMTLRPDINLKRIVDGYEYPDFDKLDKSIIEHVRSNENIPLNNFYVTHIARKISPYEIRGTSIIVSCFRDLLKLEKEQDNLELINNVNIGLMVPSVINEDSLKLLCKRYKSLKLAVTKWLDKKIFTPIAQIQDFYEYVDGEKKVIIPKTMWKSDSYN